MHLIVFVVSSLIGFLFINVATLSGKKFVVLFVLTMNNTYKNFVFIEITNKTF
jgi:hypothetical protein